MSDAPAVPPSSGDSPPAGSQRPKKLMVLGALFVVAAFAILLLGPIAWVEFLSPLGAVLALVGLAVLIVAANEQRSLKRGKPGVAMDQPHGKPPAADAVSPGANESQPSAIPGIIAGIIALLLPAIIPVAVILVGADDKPMRRQTAETLHALTIVTQIISVIIAIVLVAKCPRMPGRVFGWLILVLMGLKLLNAAAS